MIFLPYTVPMKCTKYTVYKCLSITLYLIHLSFVCIGACAAVAEAFLERVPVPYAGDILKKAHTFVSLMDSSLTALTASKGPTRAMEQ